MSLSFNTSAATPKQQRKTKQRERAEKTDFLPDFFSSRGVCVGNTTLITMKKRGTMCLRIVQSF
jgi:hypothetical protein